MRKVKKYITCQKKDRIGMQIYSRLWTAYFAKQEGFEYIHTPLEDPYESVFNLGSKFHNICEKELNKITIFSDEANYTPIIKCGLFADFSSKFMQSIIKNYTPLENTLRQGNQTNICIHARRGDTANEEYKNCKPVRRRACSTEDLKNILDYIHYYINPPFSINIHTDGNINLRELNTHGMRVNVYDRNTPELIAINDMILCDILFPSGISSFSGIAGIYNKNTVISKSKGIYDNLYIQKNRKYITDLL
jgi:hypothetical protein